jgi:tRNA U54 and U55 pseudouridine synthase Pus10
MRGPVVNRRTGDGDWWEESKFIAELTTVNTWIGRYVLRFLDADAGRTKPSSPQDEQALGDRLVALGVALQTKARQSS